MTTTSKLFTPQFFRRLQQLKIRTRRNFLGTRQGSHLSTRRGQGLEFAEHRPYTPGDDYRHIDWGVYGRTDRVYVREFRAEQDLSIFIVLDTSASMAFPEGEKKFETAKDLSLALAYIGLADGDSVTLAPLGQRVSPRYVGQRSLSRLISAIGSIQAQNKVDLLHELRGALTNQRFAGRCFVISDFLFEPEVRIAMLDTLRSKNFEVSVVHIVTPTEMEPAMTAGEIIVDSETGEELQVSLDRNVLKQYAREMGEHISSLEHFCSKNGISYIRVRSDESIEEVVLKKFPQAGLLS